MTGKIEVDLDAVAQRPLPGTRIAVSAKFSVSGQHIYYLLANTGSILGLHRFAIDAESDEVLLEAADQVGKRTLDEEMRRERLRIGWEGVAGFQLFEDSTDQAILAINQGGRFQLRDAWTMALLADLSDEGFVRVDASFDLKLLIATDGKTLSTIDLVNNKIKVLISSENPEISYGVAEYVAQEELDRLEGFWLSPDGRNVAFCEVDESMVARFPLLRTDRDQVSVEEHRYPFAGEPNAAVRLGVVEIDSTDVTWAAIPCEPGHYICKVFWLDLSQIAIATLNRGQDELTWWIWEPGTGDLVVRCTRVQKPWINLASNAIAIDGAAILTTDEESGFAHLCTINQDGTITWLTWGEFAVTELLAYDPTSDSAYVIATLESPLERHLYRVTLASPKMERLTVEAGVHNVVLDPGFRYFLDQYSSRAHGVRSVCRSLDSSWSTTLVESDETANSTRLVVPEIFTITAVTGETLYGAVYLPLRSGQALLPGVVSVYGGPHAQMVTESWSMTVDLQAQYLVAAGLVVVKLDNRGSTGRGREFESYLDRRFGTVELEDQVQAVGHVISEYGVDPDRIGIYGWSYGGFMAIAAMVFAPEVFRVGVAGAPVVDFKFYDTAYTERYMGQPQDNPAGYLHANLGAAIASLRGKLMVIHGLIDENVHFRHTARLIEAGIAQRKEIELVLLPESRHAPRGYETLLQIAKRRSDFLISNL